MTCNWAASVDNFLQHFIAARSGNVDATWWTSLFTYHGSTGSGHSPYVTGHINTLFPWDSANKWTGVQSAKSSFPIGMNSVPLIWVLKKTFFLWLRNDVKMEIITFDDGCYYSVYFVTGFLGPFHSHACVDGVQWNGDQ